MVILNLYGARDGIVGCPGAERDGSLWQAERFRPVRHERVADDAGRADHPSILGSLRNGTR